MKIPRKGVGEMIKELRLNRNLTQEQLAEKVGKHRSYIGRIETKDGENIKISTLVEIVEKGLNGKIIIKLNE
jgi:transcriptional regulator with XRE-family HTH domain